MLSDGRVMVTGGVDNKHTSVYDPIANDWVADLPMNIGRGYQVKLHCQSSIGEQPRRPGTSVWQKVVPSGFLLSG